MARQKFIHFVPRDKPPKRPRRHKKNLINKRVGLMDTSEIWKKTKGIKKTLTNPKREATRNIIDKVDNILY